MRDSRNRCRKIRPEWEAGQGCRIPRIAGALLLAALAAPLTAEQSAADLHAVILGLQSRYASVHTIRAAFRQTYRAPGIDQTEVGALVMKKPGLMRWEYRQPEVKFFVADGRNTYLYTPADRQVLVRPFSAGELQSTPLQFLLGRGDILKSFAVQPEREFSPRVEGTVLVRLLPRSGEADYSYLVLECDAATHDLRRLVIRERTGNTSEFLLTEVETNIRTKDSDFQFKIPKGVEVIHMEAK